MSAMIEAFLFLAALFHLTSGQFLINYTYGEFEIEPYDGYYNNLAVPDLGAVGK